MDKDPNHWLYRLTADEWLQAARNELSRAERALAQRQHRTGVTGARRAAGMAWNAVLTISPDDHYGRSYMEHLKALSDEAAAPELVRLAAQALLAAPLAPPLVTLGRGDTRLADAARAILEFADARIAPTASA